MLASVTITLYIPAVRFDMSSDVEEFDHWYWNGGTPPKTVKSILPLLPELQLTLVWLKLTAGDTGSVIVIVSLLVQRLASVIVIT